ncbi:MAG: GNAT family N-acetyltransferase [Patescibacteria group bacterium]
METKIFDGKKIIIRKISKSDLKNARSFLDHINLLVEEKAMLLINKKQTLKDEAAFLREMVKKGKRGDSVCLVAKHSGRVVGLTDINIKSYSKNHIGNFGISIRRGYRGIGLGKYLMAEIIKLAKKELKPKPKIIQLEVYANNAPAIALYKKMGFKIVAKVPKQVQWKGKLIDEFVMLKFL